MKARRPVATVLLNMGSIHRSFGRYEHALACYARAERIMKKAGTRSGIADLLANRASVYIREGRLDLALDCYRRACDNANHPLEEASRLVDIGRVLRKLGCYREALEELSRAIELSENSGDHDLKVTLHFQMGRVHLRMDHPGKAMASAGRGLDILNRLGHGLSTEERFGQRKKARMASDIGFRAARKILASKVGDRARILEGLFRMVEAGRGLLLAEDLLNREVLADALLPPDLRDAESKSRRRVKAIQKKLQVLFKARSSDSAAVDRVRKALRTAYHDLEECVSRVKRSARRVAAVLYPEPVQLRMLQEHLAEEEAFVYFDLPTGKNRAAALVVTREKVVLVPLEAAGPIMDRLGRFRRLVTNDRSDERSVLAPGLYDSLLRPIEKAILEKKRLIISPDGVLAYLPFEALIRTEGERAERVIERWEVTYVPSATVFLSLIKDVRDKPEGRGVLALGDPVYEDMPEREKGSRMAREASLRGLGKPRRLKESGREVRELAKLFSAEERTVLLREEASVAGFKKALKSLPGRLAAVHLACHAHLDTLRPRLTGLVLSGGEVLTLDDIFQLKIPAELAVLSACSTAQGKVERGEGVVGLVRGFFLAGCPRVVVSDWDVDDAITRRFMVAYYRNMFEGGLAPGSALRATKLDMLRGDPDRTHPAHWAAFVLWGLGK